MYLDTCFTAVVLFGEVMETLGGRHLLEEVHHWRQALRVYSLCPTSCTRAVLPVCESKM